MTSLDSFKKFAGKVVAKSSLTNPTAKTKVLCVAITITIAIAIAITITITITIPLSWTVDN